MERSSDSVSTVLFEIIFWDLREIYVVIGLFTPRECKFKIFSLGADHRYSTWWVTPPELGPDSAGIQRSVDARCGALYRCSEAAIPPYFMQIIDLETQYAYKKNNLSIQCEQNRPRIFEYQVFSQGLRSWVLYSSVHAWRTALWQCQGGTVHTGTRYPSTGIRFKNVIFETLQPVQFCTVECTHRYPLPQYRYSIQKRYFWNITLKPSMLINTIHIGHDTIWWYETHHDEELGGCVSAIRPSF